MPEFQEQNLNGSRSQLYAKLRQNYVQGGGNTAVINTETLRELTLAEYQESENN
jgi:hypothetical protein